MADGSISGISSLAGKVSAEEWRVRVELAALYRLVALHGWDFLVYNHVSARAPGPEHHFLINPYGLMFEEITASSLVKIDLDGNVLQDTPYSVNAAGFTIHSAVHAAREDAQFVIHLHTNQGAAVSAQEHGLLPFSQDALTVVPHLAYHDYEGVAVDLGERERIVADLGDKTMMLLRNHGTLAVGETAADCWVRIWFLERACTEQVMALAAGRENVRLAPAAAQAQVAGISSRANRRGISGAIAWPALLRKLDRCSPGYDA